MARETQMAKIGRLEQENQELKNYNNRILKEFFDLERKYTELSSNQEEHFKNLPLYQKLITENEILRSNHDSLNRQIDCWRDRYYNLLKESNTSESI